MRPLRFFKDLRFSIFYRLLQKAGGPLVTMGDICKWTFCDERMGAEAKVICAGAGNDISFEKALIERYGCRVVLLDPSPTGVKTVQQENDSRGLLQFLEVGLAGDDGILSFEDPEDATEGSFRESSANAPGRHRFSCKSLSTLMAELGWRRIDLLKMDIEGFEYGVIEDLLTRRLDVRQVCVEFHYGAQFCHTRREMIRSILGLRRAGYDLVYHLGWDHTFVRRVP